MVLTGWGLEEPQTAFSRNDLVPHQTPQSQADVPWQAAIGGLGHNEMDWVNDMILPE